MEIHFLKKKNALKNGLSLIQHISFTHGLNFCLEKSILKNNPFLNTGKSNFKKRLKNRQSLIPTNACTHGLNFCVGNSIFSVTRITISISKKYLNVTFGVMSVCIWYPKELNGAISIGFGDTTQKAFIFRCGHIWNITNKLKHLWW